MPPARDNYGVLTLAEAAPLLEPGDVVLFRPERVSPPWRRWLSPKVLFGALVGRAICATGRTEWCHVGMLIDARSLLVAEMRESLGRGGVRTLDACVAAGVVDVVRPSKRAPMNLGRAVETMRVLIDRGYGYGAIARSLLWHTPMARMLLRPPTDDTASIAARRPLYCSAAVAYALRVGGVDPVPHLHDELTEPGDLGRSLLFRPVCTIAEAGERPGVVFEPAG